MFAIASTVVFFISLHCSEIAGDLNLLSAPDDNFAVKDLRTVVFFPHCNNQTILNLLCMNKGIRANVHQYLFDQYSLDTFAFENRVANVLISRYFIASLDTMYGHTTKLLATHRVKCELFSKSEENRYLKILAKKTNFYEKFKNKFSNWHPMKKRIFDHFIENKNKPELAIKEMFDFIFEKTYVYAVDRDILLITQDSETKLKNKRIFRYFCSFHAIINNISRIERPKARNHTDEDWSWLYVPLLYFLGTYRVSTAD